MINRPVQRLHLLEEYRDSIQNERKTSAVAAVRTLETIPVDQKDGQPQLTDIQRSLKPRRGQRDSNDFRHWRGRMLRSPVTDVQFILPRDSKEL